MSRRTSSHRLRLSAAIMVLVLSGWAVSPAAANFICDFEDPLDPLCINEGVVWGNEGGHPTLAAVPHSGSQSLYNNGNGSISYSGPPVQSLWIRSWAGFPATQVTLQGPDIVVDFSNSLDWQLIDVEGATYIKFVPNYYHPSQQRWMYGFGTFAIDDLNVVPEPASLALLAVGGVALIRRKRRSAACGATGSGFKY